MEDYASSIVSFKEFLIINLRDFFPAVVLKYFSLLKASFFETKYSQKINLNGRLEAVLLEFPWKCSVNLCLKFDVEPIYSLPSFKLRRT